MKLKNKKFGDIGEKRACEYLKKSEKYKLITSNFKGRHGEIDLIMTDRDILVFIEVKTRAYTDSPDFPAWRAVNREKQRHITSAAGEYLASLANPPACRFDVVEVYLDEESGRERINHFKNAHEAVYQ